MIFVRDLLPLQQGLRPLTIPSEGRTTVRDLLPLQQGLRLRLRSHKESTKTWSETYFHYNKD
ncbi:MAG: hypothetical protein ACRC6R_08970 [Bacteroidales bacterium]